MEGFTIGFHQPPTTFVGQVNINVENLERALSFYKEVIGFNILEKTETKVHLTADGFTTLVTIEQPEDAKSKEQHTTGLYHFAILLPKRSDLANIVKHLADNGVKIGASDHFVSEALYLNDPDGNGIEIYIDRPAKTWDWQNGQVNMGVDPLNFEDLLSDISGEWNGLPENTVMGHIHLHVAELDKTEDFYAQGLGFEVVTRYGKQALFMSTGKYHHHIGLNTWNGVGAPAPSPNSVGLNWFSLVFPTEEARSETVKNLKQIGYKTFKKNGIYNTTDPSGNRIHLLVYE